MIIETVKALVEVLKLAPRYLAAVALIAGALIFLPGSWLDFLGLQEFSVDNRSWLGLAFIVSVGVCIVAILTWIIDLVVIFLRARSIRNFIVDKLLKLTEDEKQILRYYVAMKTRSNMLRVDDGVVQELVACGIIYRSTQVGSMLDGFAHNISDLAWDYIHANPEILQGTTNRYRTDKRQRFW